jgi:hypothetical protein
MNDTEDKRLAIAKFLNHIDLGKEDKIVSFNSKISYLNLSFWIFLFVFFTALVIKPEYFSIYKLIVKSQILDLFNINKDNFQFIVMIFDFAILTYIFYIHRLRIGTIESLYGLKILLEYMRVDEVYFFNTLKHIFPNLPDFELAEFTNSVFTRRILRK